MQNNNTEVKTVKYLLTFTGIILILCIIVTAKYYPSADKIAPGSEEKASVHNTTVSFSQVSRNQYQYYISVSSGRVALFETDCQTPLRITGTRVRDLPLSDRDALKKGIGAYDLKSAEKIMQEYCS